ncbi:hypothetical protein ACET3Z_028065 [Daucus carota]
MREFLVQIFNEYSIKFGSNKGYGEGSASASLSSASSVGGEWLGGFQDFIASQSGRTSEEGASQACDISSDDWDIEWDMDF